MRMLIKKGHDRKEAPVYASEYEEKAVYFLEGLGGKENIKDVTNCATRLRITVIDPGLVEDREYFTKINGRTEWLRVVKAFRSLLA